LLKIPVFLHQVLRVQVMPLYAFVLRVVYFGFQRNPECPFAGIKIRRDVLAKITNADREAWLRDVISVRPEDDEIRVIAINKVKLIINNIQNLSGASFKADAVLEFYFNLSFQLK